MRHRLHFHHLLVGSLEILASAHWKDVMIPSNGAGRTSLFISRPALIQSAVVVLRLTRYAPFTAHYLSSRDRRVTFGWDKYTAVGSISLLQIRIRKRRCHCGRLLTTMKAAWSERAKVYLCTVSRARERTRNQRRAAVLCVRLARIGTPREPPLSGGSHRKYLSISSFEGGRLSHRAHFTHWSLHE